MPTKDKTDPLYVKMIILKLEDIFKQQVGSLMWDCEIDKLPSCLLIFSKILRISTTTLQRMPFQISYVLIIGILQPIMVLPCSKIMVQNFGTLFAISKFMKLIF